MKSKSLIAVLVCALPVVGSAAKKPVFVNFDNTHFYSLRSTWKEVGDKEVRDFVRQFRGSDVSDLMFCIGGRIADVTNSVKMCWLDKYDQTHENGRDVCYTNGRVLSCVKRIQRDAGIDPYAVWIEEARKAGIRAWLSFRMNDSHATLQETSHLHPDFYHEHPEYRRIRHRETKGYFDRCFDWGIAAVRDRELGYVAEILSRYGMDGVEIDWMREPYCFVPGRESVEIMTDVMRRVREFADKAATRLGRPVRVAVRVPASPRSALELGFDVVDWAEKGLVDVVTPSPRWLTTDANLPVDLWERMLRGTKVKLVPGVEILIGASLPNKYIFQTKNQLLGNLNALYSGGADGVYLYNFFDDPRYDTQGYFRKRQPFKDMAVYYPNYLALLGMIGSPEKVSASDRDHMLTFDDLATPWRDYIVPFPTRVYAGQTRSFRVVTGGVPLSAKVYVRLGIAKEGPTPPVDVFVNGRPCRFVRREPCVPAFTDQPLHVYAVTGMTERVAVVETVLPGKSGIKLVHLDIIVRNEENKK